MNVREDADAPGGPARSDPDAGRRPSHGPDRDLSEISEDLRSELVAIIVASLTARGTDQPRQVASDLVQSALASWARVRRAGKYAETDQGSVRAIIIGIARHKIAHHFRDRMIWDRFFVEAERLAASGWDPRAVEPLPDQLAIVDEAVEVALRGVSQGWRRKVAELSLSGLSYREILDHLAGEYPKLTPSQVRHVITEANKRLAESLQADGV
jgi:DNA-directed RNA polymerase specialized sigma24 family protein